MSLFEHLYALREFEVNGQQVNDDNEFDIEEPTDAAADNATAAPADQADNAAEEAGDQATDDDFTLEDEEDANDDTVDQTTEEDIDQTTTDDDTTDEADDNFTIEGNDAEGGEAEGEDAGDETNDEGGNEPAANNAPANPTDEIDDDEQRAAEEAIYDSLTDDQKRIRILQLKIDYKDLYETLINTIESVNDIPKTADNLESIKRLQMFLVKAKSILIDYVENNFDKNTYLENYTTYIKYMAIFRTTAKVIEEINNANNN